MKKLLFILALSIQATANDQVIVQALQGLANQWNEPVYSNQMEYQQPTDSYAPYKQYMQRQMQFDREQAARQEEIRQIREQLKRLE